MGDNAPNVVLFGQTGSGKSSIINMLLGTEKAPTSSGVIGHTFKSDRYQANIGGRDFNLFDTTGLGEGDEGRVPTRDAIKNLYQLVQSLSGGLSLLVFVFRGRLNETARRNYKMFYDTFCNRKVPIVLVVTGMENESNVDEWWGQNSTAFRSYGMKFSGHACITAVKGRRVGEKWSLQREFDRSQRDVEKLILDCYMRKPWSIHSTHWFTTTLSRLLLVEKLTSKGHLEQLEKALIQNAGMTKKDAQEEARQFRAEETDTDSIPDGKSAHGCLSIFLALFGLKVSTPQTKYDKSHKNS
ncbi:hypothetical protein CPB86DRAFT_741976 [Serendipita vermifera]|nr:hypothetical protein CPB86DRAFT_741976 [Serendipita vermifera]